MNLFRRILMVGLVLVMAGTVFAGPGNQGGSGGAFDPAKTPVAVAISVMNHPVHRIVQLGFLKAARELGYTNSKVIGTEGPDQSEVYAAADAFIAEGGKGLLLWAGDSTAFETIRSAASQGVVVGIPHFNLQTNGRNPEGLAFGMACDPPAYGRQVAEFMAERLSGRSGSIAITQNTRNVTENGGSDSFIATWNSLKSRYNLNNIRLLPVQLEGGVVDQATAVNLAIIQANRDIIGAFGLTGNSPITWADAATKAGRRDGEILIVGMDATEGNLNYLDQGKVAAIVAQPLYEEAYKTMQYLDTIFRGGTVPAWTDLDAPVVTKDGSGPNGIAYHRAIAAEVATFFK
ncbi:MAG: substrate-binding domain-containing protein [Treponema sp.]|nr:substrate-binding domain-containing protein [Treponema sp.]